MIIVFRIEESHWWVKTLRPQGGCNVLSALKQVIKRKEIDSIVLVLGSWYEFFITIICSLMQLFAFAGGFSQSAKQN